MKKIAPVVFSLVFALGANAEGQQGAPPSQPAQLFYVFSAEDDAQRLGARQLQAWKDGHEGWLQVMGLVRHQGDLAVMEQLRVQEGISFQLVCASAAQHSPGLPAELASHLDSAEGFVLLVDGSGRAKASGAAAELDLVLNRAALLVGGLAATEVDESTWGKVKEIFK